MGRERKNEMRRMCPPEPGTHAAKGPAMGDTRQYKQTGKKYSGPNYNQKDTNVKASGSLK